MINSKLIRFLGNLKGLRKIEYHIKNNFFLLCHPCGIYEFLGIE